MTTARQGRPRSERAPTGHCAAPRRRGRRRSTSARFPRRTPRCVPRGRRGEGSWGRRWPTAIPRGSAASARRVGWSPRPGRRTRWPGRSAGPRSPARCRRVASWRWDSADPRTCRRGESSRGPGSTSSSGRRCRRISGRSDSRPRRPPRTGARRPACSGRSRTRGCCRGARHRRRTSSRCRASPAGAADRFRTSHRSAGPRSCRRCRGAGRRGSPCRRPRPSRSS